MRKTTESHGVWTIGIRVTRKVGLPVKLGGLTVAMLVPLAIFTTIFLQQHYQQNPLDPQILSSFVPLLLALIGFTLILYLLISVYKCLHIDIEALKTDMSQVAAGNLQVTDSIFSRDEIGELSSILRTMIVHVSTIVASVASEGALVASVGRKLTRGNQELSDRTEQQAANLEQTAASVHELAATVQKNAYAAIEVDRHAAYAKRLADAGSIAMMRSIESVEAIQSSAHKMSEIVGVIDGLAFQTNILALNAAVEAARAGEQGRGFAVVASEVRSLAQRSAGSAREIRKLIQESTLQVESSVLRIREAGEGMTGIVCGVRDVSKSISQISAASSEQSASLGEISTAVAQLDRITQQNAQMVERAVEHSIGLESQAHSLTTATSSFRLTQGSPSEAVSLVERAIDHWRQCGSRHTFLRDITDMTKAFYDRDMYVFVLDKDGTYLAFGGNPEKVGTRVQDIPGFDGQALLENIVQQSADEPGWVEYEIANHKTGKVQVKMSYIFALNGLAIGCGVYKHLAG